MFSTTACSGPRSNFSTAPASSAIWSDVGREREAQGIDLERPDVEMRAEVEGELCAAAEGEAGLEAHAEPEPGLGVDVQARENLLQEAVALAAPRSPAAARAHLGFDAEVELVARCR